MTQVQSSQNCSESCKKEKEDQFKKIITLGEERNVAVRERDEAVAERDEADAGRVEADGISVQWEEYSNAVKVKYSEACDRKQEQVVAGNKVIEARDTELKATKQALEAKKEELAGQERKVKTREAIIADLKQGLAKALSIASINLPEYEATMKQKDSELRAKNSEVAAKTVELQGKISHLAAEQTARQRELE